MDSWVTLDLWVNPYPIIYFHPSIMTLMSLYSTVDSSKGFITLYMLRSQTIC